MFLAVNRNINMRFLRIYLRFNARTDLPYIVIQVHTSSRVIREIFYSVSFSISRANNSLTAFSSIQLVGLASLRNGIH